MNQRLVGIGDTQAALRVYIGNRPPVAPFDCLDGMLAAQVGSIHQIGQQCGNGWRKVFNVYAKLVFALADTALIKGQSSWQDYRDKVLLRAHSNTALLFSSPACLADAAEQPLHIVMGKHYANTLPLPADLQWLDSQFALSLQQRWIICPYFDYRQLSNIKIIRLVELIRRFDTRLA